MRVEPKEIIRKYKETQSVVLTAKLLGIHKVTVYRWLKRARSPYPYGAPKYKERRGLKRKSTKPKKIHYALTSNEKIKIETLRNQYGYTAKKLKKAGDIKASVATIERSFRTDEEEFIFYKAPFSDYDDLRFKYTSWLKWYNSERPHLGIDLKTPLEVINSVRE